MITHDLLLFLDARDIHTPDKIIVQEYIRIHLAEHLPKTAIQGRRALPIVWEQDEIKKIEDSAERISPAGKNYAMVLFASRLGLRIGDIRNLKFHDIDWVKKQISMIQHKTQKAPMFLCATGLPTLYF